MKKQYYAPKIIRLIAFHLRLGYARTSTTKCNEPMPRGWNRQAVDIVVKKHGVYLFTPKFGATTENVVFGTTTKVTN
jgi:hypothetical protein